MQENFTLSIPHFQFHKAKTILASLVLAFIIIYPLGLTSTPSIVSFILLAFIIHLLITNMSQENKQDSLPFTTYPTPPHLGLDGIDVDNLVAGVPLPSIQNIH